MTTPKLSRSEASKLKRLLHMRYKPSEIAREMGISTDTLYRSYIPSGAPCEKDTQGSIWIVGDAFAAWAVDYVRTKKGQPAKRQMANGQAYCVRCNKVIEIQNLKKSTPNARGVINISGRCPLCAGKVNRFVKKAEVEQ